MMYRSKEFPQDYLKAKKFPQDYLKETARNQRTRRAYSDFLPSPSAEAFSTGEEKNRI
jgi:hypothetical protein